MPRRFASPRDRTDGGGKTIEYIALGMLAVVIVAGLAVGGVGARLGDAVRNTVCAVVSGGRDCPRTGTPQARGTAPPGRTGSHAGSADQWIVPLDRLPVPKPKKKGERRGELGEWKPRKDEPWFEFRDRGDFTWDCGIAGDVACKIGGGFAQGGKDLFDGVASAGCLLHLCSHSGFKSTWGDTLQMFKQNPLTTASQMWKGFSKPFVDNWRNGGPGKAIAYGMPAALGGLLKPFKLLRAGRDAAKAEKAEKAAKRLKGHAPRHRAPTSPRTDRARARQAAESGDIAGADKAIASLRKRFADAKRSDRSAGCPVALPYAHRRTPVAHAAFAALPADPEPGDCGAVSRLARELGFNGEAEIQRMLDTENARRDFFASPRGAAARRALAKLEGLTKESDGLADSGSVRKAKARASDAHKIAKGLRARARKEKDPKRKAILGDAATTAEALAAHVADNARTAAVVHRIDTLPYNRYDREAHGQPPVRELYHRLRPVIDYDGVGASYVDDVNPTADGRPLLRVDRSRFNSDAELTANVIHTVVLNENGYFRKGPGGLRRVSGFYWNPDHPRPRDRASYAAHSLDVHEKAYMPAVRELWEQDADPVTVADPVMREVYTRARAAAKKKMADSGMRDSTGHRLKPKDVTSLQDDGFRDGITAAMHTPMDDLGGRSPYQVALDEYDSVVPPHGN
ncbi:MAG TPA: hypothetical protein VGL93_36375 [Streptosporangiaceae bacterium]|jgi:hypothetical protein